MSAFVLLHQTEMPRLAGSAVVSIIAAACDVLRAWNIIVKHSVLRVLGLHQIPTKVCGHSYKLPLASVHSCLAADMVVVHLQSCVSKHIGHR